MSQRFLKILVALLIFGIGIGGCWWFIIRPEQALRKERVRFVERPVLAEGAPADHLQLTAKIKAVEGDYLLLVVKEGVKKVALDRYTSIFTLSNGEVSAGKVEDLQAGREVELVYPEPAEGEIPTALSVLITL